MMHLAVFTSHTEGTTSFLCSEYFPFPQTFPLGLGDGQFYAWTDGLRRKDWHDYGSMQKEAMRSESSIFFFHAFSLTKASAHTDIHAGTKSKSTPPSLINRPNSTIISAILSPPNLEIH
ncbi:hypothetical protein FD755_019656 [Muntiacus reevesi]|uniref:Uncharacterized protein n=1 Tax=Muntiacus reevesi TaxID=9886 RepID=A0A5N3X409_MUNRE|nr:hypothetical protein FD755_019656 [Muntiacus reevesi]